MGTILDVAIGLTVVYLLFAIVCSAINEAIAWGYGLRANTLRRGIASLLGRSEEMKALFEHPIIKGLHLSPDEAAVAKPGQESPGPSYVPARLFVSALLDQLREKARQAREKAGEPVGVKSDKPLDELRDVLAADAWASRALLPLLDETVTSVADARQQLERWFDDSMTRVSGDYKRKAQRNILLIATFVCAICNVDSLQLARSLYSDAPQRAALVSAADRLRQTPVGGRAEAEIEPALAELTRATSTVTSLDLPIGWHEGAYPSGERSDPLAWIGKVLGIFCSVVAVSLGAPFWFEMMNKIANLRTVGAPPPPAAASTAKGADAKAASK